ncbi:hypothetical protein R80B4_02368 [Fibrobacteres bacterium R8-0-B4]
MNLFARQVRTLMTAATAAAVVAAGGVGAGCAKVSAVHRIDNKRNSQRIYV